VYLVIDKMSGVSKVYEDLPQETIAAYEYNDFMIFDIFDPEETLMYADGQWHILPIIGE
jgi:hypothetical protein